MQTKRAKHIVDILLGFGLLLLMSYQVVGEAGHEWTGMRASPVCWSAVKQLQKIWNTPFG